MIRRCSELSSKGKDQHRHSTSSIPKSGGATNGHPTEFGVFDAEMEIDSHQGSNGHEQTVAGDSMDLDYAQSSNLMGEALMYGQRLQAEFRDDPRPEVKQALEDTFALIAYTNAEESSLAPLLKEDGRAVIAEELNSAILGESCFCCITALAFADTRSSLARLRKLLWHRAPRPTDRGARQRPDRRRPRRGVCKHWQRLPAQRGRVMAWSQRRAHQSCARMDARAKENR